MIMLLKIFATIIQLLLVTVLNGVDSLHRDEFPLDFVFGASTSAYQVEGAANEDGRKPSIWDTFSHAGNGNMYGGNGDVSCDQYHKYKTLISCRKMSNSWPTWAWMYIDFPYHGQGLFQESNHMLHYTIGTYRKHLRMNMEDGKDFTTYADVCFRKFGDRVKYWTTMNEANVYAIFGYDIGLLPPQRCSHSFITNCSRGNSPTEPYLVAHHMLLAHASAARLYRKKYQGMQHGYVGFNLLPFGLVPLTNTSEDVSATQRAQDFLIGWFMNPFTFGDYPDIMKKNAGSRLPSFSLKESNLVKGSIDFIGINFYYSFYVKNSPGSLQKEDKDYMADVSVEIERVTQNDTPTNEIPITPRIFQGVLDSFKNNYGNIPIYIHENGQQTPHNSSLDDWPRVKYLHQYIASLVDALRSGANVKGYFVWSFLDAFELMSGYESSYGLYYVDIKDPNLRRQPKLSAKWYSNFLKRKPMNSNITKETEKSST